MKKKRHSIEQIATVLKEHELGMPVADICRRLGITDATFYRWKKVYGALEPSQVRGLRQLQEESARLKRVVADLTLDKSMLQDVLAKKWDGPR